MTKAPDKIVDLYLEAQVNEDMDGGTYVGGTDHYGVTTILEAIAEMVGWELPAPMDCDQLEAYLRNNGREDELEYIGVNSGCGPE